MRRKDKPLEILSNDQPVWARNTSGQPVCGAKTSTKDGVCQTTVLFANGRCKHHGGPLVKSRGLAHPTYLRSPERMPARLRKEMEEGLAQGEGVTDLTHELALADVRIAQLKAGLEGDYPAAVWRVMRDLTNELEAALDTDSEEAEDLARKLIKAVRFGHDEKKIHAEIAQASLIRTKIAEAQVKNRVALKTMLPGGQALALGTGMVAIVREEVAKLLTSIETDLKIRLPNTYRDSCFVAIATRLGAVISRKSRPDGSFYVDPSQSESGTPTLTVQ